MNTNLYPKIRDNIDCPLISFQSEGVFLNFSNKSYLFSYYEYRIFKQIDGKKKISEYLDVNLKDACNFLSFLEGQELITLNKENKKEDNFLKNKNISKSYIEKTIIKNIEKNKFLIIGCDNDAFEITSQLSMLGGSSFILLNFQKNEENNEEVTQSNNDILWKSERMKNRILKNNANASVEIVLINKSLQEDVNYLEKINYEIDFAFIHLEDEFEVKKEVIEDFLQRQIPFILIQHTKNKFTFGPIIQKNSEEIKNVFDLYFNADKNVNQKKLMNIKFKQAKFFAQNLMHEIILYFLDRENSTVIKDIIFLNLDSVSINKTTIFFDKNEKKRYIILNNNESEKNDFNNDIKKMVI